MDKSSQPNNTKNMPPKARLIVRIIYILTAIMVLLPFALLWLTDAILF